MPMSTMAAIPMSYSAGDNKAFTKIFELYFDRLCYFADRLISDTSEAEDIVTDVFVKLWQQKGPYSSQNEIKSWLYICTRNACLSHIKQSSRKEIDKRHHSCFIENDEAILSEATKTEVIKALYILVEELPAECRKIIKLAFFEKYTSQQIAKMLGLAESTVRNQKSRGINILRQRIIKLELFHLLVLLKILSAD